MKQMSLIEGIDPAATSQPLASRMRPKDLSEFVGQEHLVGEGRILRQMIERDQIPSMILWGPPGVGHNCWTPAYADWDQVLAWFFAQRKGK